VTEAERKLACLRNDFERLARWALEHSDDNAFAGQVSLYARARLADWDRPLEEWEP
jgi:hypothetical protein